MIREKVLRRGQQDPLESRGPRRRQKKETQETGSLLLSRLEEMSRGYSYPSNDARELRRVGGRGRKASRGHSLFSLFFFSLSLTLSVPLS